ncbi:MAG: hypothetical protein AAF576_06935, partial [Pseudomonadota bacterium]
MAAAFQAVGEAGGPASAVKPALTRIARPVPMGHFGEKPLPLFHEDEVRLAEITAKAPSYLRDHRTR